MHTIITRTSAMHKFNKYLFTVVFIERLPMITIITVIFPAMPTRNIKQYKIVEVKTIYNGGLRASSSFMDLLLKW